MRKGTPATANAVNREFQITIDETVREELGIKPGDQVIQRVRDGRLVIDFIPAPHHESLLGIFRRPDLPPITDWEAVKDRAWAARADEIMEALAEDSRRHP